MKVWKFANCTIKEIDGKTLRMFYEDGNTEDIENTEQNRKVLDEGRMPAIVITEVPDASVEIRNIRKRISSQGTSLAVTLTKELKMMGLGRGDEVIITIRKP